MKKVMSQTELAKKLNYQNGQWLSNVERGMCKVPKKLISKTSEILGVPKEAILRAMTEDYVYQLRQYVAKSEGNQWEVPIDTSDILD